MMGSTILNKFVVLAGKSDENKNEEVMESRKCLRKMQSAENTPQSFVAHEFRLFVEHERNSVVRMIVDLEHFFFEKFQ